MGAGRAFLAGAAGLLALLAASALVVPEMLDWDRYRGGVAALASAALGREVHIGGPITLRLLPQPTLTAAGIAVQDRGDGVALSAGSLRLRVAPGALLAGRLDARELVLQQPVLTLPWPLHFHPGFTRLPPWIAGLHARVEDGTLRIGGFAVTDINASLGTGEAAAPVPSGLQAAGDLEIWGRKLSFTTRIAPPDGAGTVGMMVTLDGQGALHDSGGRFSGRFAADGALTGQVSARGPDLSRLLPAPAVAWRAAGRLTAAGGLAAADALDLTIGGSPASGAVALRVLPAPRLDVSLAASRLDLDAWLPVLLPHAAGQAGPALPTGIDISAESASLGGGVLRRVRAGFDLGPGGVTLHDTGAVLPGDAVLRLSGRATADAQGRPDFQGEASLSAPDLATTLRWAAGFGVVPAAHPPDGALRSADLAGAVAVAQDQVTLTGLTGRIDGIGARGGAVARLGPHPGLGIGLDLDRLPLDPWLPDPIPLSLAGFAPPALGGFGLDLRLQARTASWHGLTIDAPVLEAGLQDGRITVRRLSAGLRGASVQAAGTLAPDGTLSGATLEVRTPDAGRLEDLLPASWRASPALSPTLWAGPAALSVAAAGPRTALALRADLDVDDGHLEAQPTIDLTTGRWSGGLMLRHPAAPRLLGALGLGGAASWLGEGSLSLAGRLSGSLMSGSLGHLALDEARLTVGELAGEAALSLDGENLSGRIRAETLPLPDLAPGDTTPLALPRWIAAFPGAGAALQLEAATVLQDGAPVAQDLHAALALRDGRLRLDGIKAQAMGGTLTGFAALDAGAAPPVVSVQATLTGAAPEGTLAPPGTTARRLDGALALRATGHSPAALAATLQGTVTAEATGVTVPGFDLGAARRALAAKGTGAVEAAMRAALSGGQTGFATMDLHGTVTHGVLTLDGTLLQGPDGTAALTGTEDLAQDRVALRLGLRPAAADAPEAGLLLTGPAEQPDRVPELAAVARWEASRAAAAE